MAKVLIINDVHLTNDNSHPSSCTASYTDDLFDLLNESLDVAESLDCKAIIQLGDLFHIKAPARNSHGLIQRTIRWAKRAPCPVYVVPGNHDLLNDRLESLNEGQPLGVLYESGAVLRADKNFPDLNVYAIPWQQFWDAEQSVADSAVRTALDEYMELDTPQLIVTHAPFFPPGANPAYENYSTEKFARKVNPSGRANTQVIYGHIHDHHGEYVVNGVRYANYGALSRGSLTESNLTRQVGVTIWDSITGRFEFIPLTAKPAEEVFRVKEITQVRTTQVKLDEFLQSVGESTIEITSVESVLAQVRSLRLGKDIERVVEELLTTLE